MSENLVCKSCGAPLQPDMEKCEYCKAANPAFARPKVAKEKVYIAETPYVAPANTYASQKFYDGRSFFAYSGLPGKVVLLLLVFVALSFLYLSANKGLFNSSYAAAGGGDGMGSFLVIQVIIFGPLSGFWAMRGFMPLNSNWRVVSWFLLVALALTHLFYLGVNSPPQ